MPIIEIATVIEILAQMTIESISKNLNRSETILTTLQRLGIDKLPASRDFDTLYVYALVEYGVYKPDTTLKFFRNQYIQEAFRKSFYENNPDILEMEAKGIKEWNEETHELGALNADIQAELNEFRSVFARIVNLTRNPSEVDQSHKIASIHQLLVGVQNSLESLKSEGTTAQQIARDKPRYWEYLLTVELLRSRLDVIKRSFDDLQKGLIYQPCRMLDLGESVRWLQEKMQDLATLVGLLNLASTQELITSWGELGQPGNVVEIKRAVDKIVSGCNGLLDWAIDLRFTRVPPEFEHIRQLIENWPELYLTEVSRIPSELGTIISLLNPEGTYNIHLLFRAPENSDEVLAEIASLESTMLGK